MIPLLLLVSAQGVYAARTCGYDFYGRYRCSGLSNAARLGIGIGIAALTILVFSMLIMLRRRRLQKINESYITHPNHGQYQGQYPPGPHQPGQYQPYPPPQLPTQPSYDPSQQQWNQGNNHNQGGNWNSGAPMGQYPPNNQSQYAPPPGAPPSYTPPTHPPPTKEHV